MPRHFQSRTWGQYIYDHIYYKFPTRFGRENELQRKLEDQVIIVIIHTNAITYQCDTSSPSPSPLWALQVRIDTKILLHCTYIIYPFKTAWSRKLFAKFFANNILTYEPMHSISKKIVLCAPVISNIVRKSLLWHLSI